MRFLLVLTPRLWRDLRDALHFLTRLPIPGPVSGRNLREALGAFPLAGAVLGAVLAILDLLLGVLHLPLPVRSALVVAAWCWLTDAMHLEGLMRTVDLLRPAAGREASEQTMRVAGRPSMVTAFLVLLLKVLLLSSLGGVLRVQALVLAPLLGRWSLVLAAALFSSTDLAVLGVRRVNPLRVAEAAAITLMLVSFAGPCGMIALIICSALVWRAGRILVPRLGDHQGDLYGALVELAEVAALLVCALGVTGLWAPIIIVP
jgi:adenosylcobinamide-GDP ribazoletransferase